MKSRMLIAAVLLLAVLATIYLSLDRMIIFTLSRIYHVNISYTALKKDAVNGYSFENLKVFNKQAGIGFFSARSNLKLNKKTSIFKSLDIDFKFRDVHFITGKPEDAKSGYDTLDKLVAVPFEGRWTYKDVSGTIEIFSNGFSLKDFTANGSLIRVSASGDIFYDNKVDMTVTIYFSREVLKDIPQELRSVIMNDEPQEWKSFSVRMRGDYRAPSLQITGKLFRLNVGTIVSRD